MLETNQVSAQDDPSTAFHGVRFVLLGFDATRKESIQLKLLECGGVDAVDYGSGCTHVIVDKLLYDDPICVTARREGKVVVTGLWVDHSFDVGMAVPSTSIIYRPVRDFNGIPGAKSMVACLTGYQRPDRDDIMIMVGLMGASFSKPLVAHKVTHLICYKFEGEKYELAKKMKSIKLVNHHWLIDCLKAWELLPESDYSKSGYEVDMEVEAKDSEDEIEEKTEDNASTRDAGRNIAVSPQTTRNENKLLQQSPLNQEISRNSLYSSASKSLVNVGNSHKVNSTPRKYASVEKALVTSSPKVSLDMPLRIHGSEKSPSMDLSKISSKSHLRSLLEPSVSVNLEGTVGVTGRRSTSAMEKYGGSGVSMLPLESHQNGADIHVVKTPLKETDLQLDGVQTASVPGKREMTPSHSNSRSRRVSPDSKLHLETHQDEADFYEIAKTPLKETDLQLDETHTTSLSAKGQMDLSHGNSISKRVSSGSEFPLERHQDRADFHEVAKTPMKETDLQLDEGQTALPAKRKMALSHGSSRSRRVSPGFKSSVDSKSAAKTTDMLASEFSFDSSCESAGHAPPMTEKNRLIDVASKDGQEHSNGVLKSYKRGSKKQTSSELSLNRSGNGSTGVEMYQSDEQSTEPPVINTNVIGGRKSDQQADNSLLNTGNNGKRMTLSKKTLGSRPGVGNRRIVNSKGSIGLKKAMVQTHNAAHPDVSVITAETNCVSTGTDVMMENIDIKASTDQLHAVTNEDMLLNDDTEAPDDEAENHFVESIDADKRARVNGIGKQSAGNSEAAEVEMVNSAEDKTDSEDYNAFPGNTIALTEAKSTLDAKKKSSTKGKKRPAKKTKIMVSGLHEEPETEEPGTKRDENKAVDHNEETVQLVGKGKAKGRPSKKLEMVNSAEDKTVSEDNALPGKNIALTEAKSTIDAKKKTSSKGKKRPAKTKRMVSGLDEEPETEEPGTKRDENKAVNHNEETVQLVGKGKAKGRPSKKLKSSTDAEKENKPVGATPQSLNSDTGAAKKVPSKPPKKTTNKSMNSNLGISGSIEKVLDSETRIEPACFILCGHKLQRKEFQQVIKRLKGKVCKDSHKWSYQATHFIVPDPVRRTEKFFAAAASGSWILKMDYLTSSNEAGKFLSEEPYEWHKKGLSEDGAINLEAPRKWRLLRERTGHCAFHGMRIVIYGECIAPPLDTLKRVIKAGDGHILATSPPYSRCLESGIDFAIVCPGMPRVDMWVQEFLRHEVPCVSADYLVEYVCKPGYSLERHVQYNTHAWAEKSLKNMVSRVEEVDDAPRTPENQGTDDAACLVCDCRDRGDEMLICGDESGNRGCGAGMHLDCSDPPLQFVPEEDWFCPSCIKKESKTGAKSNSKKSRSEK